MEDLKNVLKQTEDSKSRDADGFPNEIFKEAVSGSDLLQAIFETNDTDKNRTEVSKTVANM